MLPRFNFGKNHLLLKIPLQQHDPEIYQDRLRLERKDTENPAIVLSPLLSAQSS